MNVKDKVKRHWKRNHHEICYNFPRQFFLFHVIFFSRLVFISFAYFFLPYFTTSMMPTEQLRCPNDLPAWVSHFSCSRFFFSLHFYTSPVLHIFRLQVHPNELKEINRPFTQFRHEKSKAGNEQIQKKKKNPTSKKILNKVTKWMRMCIVNK